MLNFRQAKKKIWVLLALFSLLTQNLLPFYSLLPNAVYAEDAVVVEEQAPEEQVQEPISENNVEATTDEVNEEVSVPEETPTPTETEEVLGEQESSDVEEQVEENQENNNSPPEEENTEEEILDVVILNNVAAPSLDLDAIESEGSATLVTDKADYAPTDTAIISGLGFNAGATYTLVITSEDEPPTKTEAQVTADESGTFMYAYQLDGIYRPNYKVEAKDSSGNIVAIITFTDSLSSSITPTSVGSLNSWSGSPTNTDAEKVSATQTNDADTSYIFISSTSNSDQTFTTSTAGLPVGATVNSVTVHVVAKYVQTGSGTPPSDPTLRLLVKSGTTTAASSGTALTSGYVDYSDSWITNPDTGLAWTQAEVDAMEIGVRSAATQATRIRTPHVTHIYKIVDYTEAVTPTYTCQNDAQGADDEPGQKDLTQMCRDTSSTDPVNITWNWDDTAWSGNNSGDACALFDTNSNGLADYAVCVQVTNDPATFDSQYVYSCNDTSAKRCYGSALVSPVTTTCDADVQTGTNPFDSGSDTVATCSVVLDDVGGAGSANLLDVCSYPSAQPNSDPSDCVVASTAAQTGTVELTKIWSGAGGQTTLNIGTSVEGTEVSSVQTGANGGAPLTTGTKTIDTGTYYVSESGGLTDYTPSLACTKNGQSYVVGANNSVIVGNNDVFICTFTNTRDTGSVKVNKKVDSGSGFVDANPGSFTWSLDTVGTNAMGSTVSGVNTGSHDVNENTVTDYHFVGWYLTSDTSKTCANTTNTTLPANVSVANNTTTEITLCNAIDTGTVVVHKDVQGPSGEDVTDASNNFKVSLDGGTGQDITDDLTVIYENVPVGSHTITESLVDTDYTLYGISSVAGGAGDTGGLTINVTTGTNDVYITNRQKSATITVVKDVVNPDGGAVSDTHTFTVNLTPGSQSDTFAEGDNAVFTVNPGTYTASENDDANYDELGCLTATGKADIVVGSGESVTITCTNKQKKATIDVIKDVLSPTSGAVSDNHAFTAQLNGGLDQSFSEATTASYLVNPGNYSITELSDNNYDYVSCTPDSNQTAGDGAQVTVGSNGSVTVTCTNKQKNAQVTVVKDVRDPNGSDVSDNTNFVVQRDGSGTDDKTFREGLDAIYTLVPGTYTFAELVTAGYTLNSVNPDDDTDVNNGTTVTLNSGQNVTITFTNYQNAGSISGQKLSDTDGVLGTTTDQTNLTSWVINLYTCSSDFLTCVFSATDTTDGSGYSFLNLVPGYYQVSEVLQGGWTALTSLFQNVTVDPGEVENIDFVNFDNVSVTACKKVDADGNIATTDDQTPAYWEMALLVDGQASGGAQFTDRTTGCYTWVDLGPGHTYGVSEATPSGWTTLTDTTHSFGSATGGSEYTYTFVNFENVSISGQKYNDLNGDGIEDAGEPGLANWTINLNGDAQTTTTNGDGYYEFTDLGPGTYTLSETGQDGWTQTYPEDPDTHSVTVESGQNVEDKDFGNTRDTGNITVHKLFDLDGDLETTEDRILGEDWEMSVEGNSDDTSNPEPQDTDVNGETTFDDLKTGTYNVFEDLKDGYDMLDAYCDEENGEWDGGIYDVEVGKEDTVNCTFINSPNGKIHGYKWNDINGNGQNDEEDLLGGWRIFIDENENQEWDEEEQFMLTDDGEELGWYWFENLFPGTYEICEELQSGWIQTYPLSPTCHTVTLPDTSEEEELQNRISGVPYNFGNQEVDPILEISKVNNTGGADKSTGSEVVYTITLEITESDAEDVTVTDLLPEGFTYKGGSWHVLVNESDVTIPEPVYASPGTWLLGNLNKGDIVKLIYTAVISSSQEQGLYKDLAWAKAEGSTILALAQTTGFVDTNFVGTQVNVVKSESSSVNIEKKVEGEVLGAATEALPATGGNTLHLVIAILMLVFGLNLVYAGYIIRKRYV